MHELLHSGNIRRAKLLFYLINLSIFAGKYFI